MTEIVVDTSAFVAIFKREPEAPSLRERLNSAGTVLVPACCLVELALLRRLHPQLLDWAQELCLKASYSLIELTLEEAQLAVKAAKNTARAQGTQHSSISATASSMPRRSTGRCPCSSSAPIFPEPT
ncbi:type II toxin-antitoxin system VapC family toxin [Pseudaminobacter sp. 19-2017]|uniref:Type II toxin-antitoxin system VapC family toxin n=1 Tax=Pseudaminobacter soli (ex Zhang et al. 2022) TaxID=2831468 RepID=A0A942E3D7_9HYPH|nr:type II toxin-antitoxin system VapC family toxin [Pseudaminobacter soli]